MWSSSPLKYSKVLQWSSHQPYPGRLQLTNNERACRGSNANNDGVTSDRFTPPSHHVTEEEVTTSNSCSVWEVHKNLYLIFLLYLQVLYKALLCSWPPRQLTSLWGTFWAADWNYVNFFIEGKPLEVPDRSIMCLSSPGWQIQIMPGFLCRGKTDHIGVTLFSGWRSLNHCPLYCALKQCNPFGLALPLHKTFNCDRTLLNQPVLVSYWEAYGWYQHWYQGPYWACMTWAQYQPCCSSGFVGTWGNAWYISTLYQFQYHLYIPALYQQIPISLGLSTRYENLKAWGCWWSFLSTWSSGKVGDHMRTNVSHA
jgi:hypothetical protein